MKRPSEFSGVWRQLSPWAVLAVVASVGAAVVAGVFDPGFSATWLAVVIGAITLSTAGWDLSVRQRGAHLLRPFGAMEGPLLWVSIAWAVLRMSGAYGAHISPLVAGLLAWLVATASRQVSSFTLGVAAALEVGLTVAGRQTPEVLVIHAVIFGLLAYGLSRFARGEAFRERVIGERVRAERDAETEGRAADFGLLTTQMPLLKALPRIEEVLDRPTVGHVTLDYLTQSFTLQLELLRAALGLTTAAVLWRRPGSTELHLRGYASGRDDLVEGPFSMGAGLPAGVLRDVREVAVVPVSDRPGLLPYYPSSSEVGGAMAVAIPAPTETATGQSAPPAGVLCVDRVETTAWTESERQTLRLMARKLSLDVSAGQHLKAIDHERSTVERFCAGLQELNSTLGLAQVADAAMESVRALIEADMVALTLVTGGTHRVVRADGLYADRLKDLTFNGAEGLVGRACEVGLPVPSSGQYDGSRPVFGADEKLSGLRSLLVVPLKVEGEDALVGTLVVGAQAPGVFVGAHRDMLMLIAGQVAIKLDLARAHEQISELATTDGLTGLKNHRTFQQTFDQMLKSATRRNAAMSFVLADIDHFKGLNDTYGHPFGDEVLKSVAQALAGAVRDVDLPARYGGEEFAVLLEDSSQEGARQTAERIRSDIEALSFEHPDGPVKVTISLGIASYPIDGKEKSLLIDRADQALYQAKDAGRNQVKVWAEVAELTGC